MFEKALRIQSFKFNNMSITIYNEDILYSYIKYESVLNLNKILYLKGL